MKSPAFLFLLICLFCSAVHPVWADQAEPALVPTWRFTVDPEDYDPLAASLGMYRRIGTSWDAGLYLNGGVSGASDEATRVEDRGETKLDSEDEYTRHAANIQLALDLRRWRRQTSSLSVFWGLRTECRFRNNKTTSNDWSTRTTDEVEESTSESEETSETVSAGLSALLGADLTLLRHLSIGIYFRPIRISGSWDLSRSTHYDEDDIYQDLEISSSKYRRRDADYNIGFGLEPALRLSLSF